MNSIGAHGSNVIIRGGRRRSGPSVRQKAIDGNLSMLSVLRDKLLAVQPILDLLVASPGNMLFTRDVLDLLQELRETLSRWESLDSTDLTVQMPVIPERIIVGPYALFGGGSNDVPEYLYAVRHDRTVEADPNSETEINARRLGNWFDHYRKSGQRHEPRPVLPIDLFEFVRPLVKRWMATGFLPVQARSHFPGGLQSYSAIISEAEYRWERAWFSDLADMHQCKAGLVRYMMWHQPGWVSSEVGRELQRLYSGRVPTSVVTAAALGESMLKRNMCLAHVVRSEDDCTLMPLPTPPVTLKYKHGDNAVPRTPEEFLARIAGGPDISAASEALFSALEKRAPCVPTVVELGRPRRSAATVASVVMGTAQKSKIKSGSATATDIATVSSRKRGNPSIVPSYRKKSRVTASATATSDSPAIVAYNVRSASGQFTVGKGLGDKLSSLGSTRSVLLQPSNQGSSAVAGPSGLVLMLPPSRPVVSTVYGLPIGRSGFYSPVVGSSTASISAASAAAGAVPATPSGADAPSNQMPGGRKTAESEPIASTSSGIRRGKPSVAEQVSLLEDVKRPVTRLTVSSGAAASPLERIVDNEGVSAEFRGENASNTDVSDDFDPVMAGLLGTVNQHPAGFMSLSEEELNLVLEAFEQE
jgi:hypothetical protein